MGQPDPEGRSNSFDYQPVRTLGDFALRSGFDCGAVSLGLATCKTSRVVMVNVDGRTVLCSTDTGDFDDGEIRHVVHQCGQLYLDVSNQPSINDFANDVRQIVISAMCRECVFLNTCCACYVRDDVDRFAGDEAWLGRYIEGLSGRVLDVGVGQGPYLSAVSERLNAGVLEVTGLDPDQTVLDRMTETGLPIRTELGLIEDFVGHDGEYDHAVAIRSLNHFKDVRIAVSRMADAVKQGGRILLVESLPLPLVRSRRKLAFSHQVSDGGFQHLRNWDSSMVLNEIKGMPLRVTQNRPIDRDTCDQWFLELERT